MLIGIDARMYGFSGIGTYLKSLLKGLGEVDKENHYICYLNSRDAGKFHPPGENFTVRTWDIPVYSPWEQVLLPLSISREPFDVFHFPHYAHPVLTRGKKVITIHDIIHYLFPQFLSGRAAFYYARFMISACLKNGDRVIVDSENTRRDLILHVQAAPEKVRMVHPGLLEHPGPGEASKAPEVLQRHGIHEPFLLYVGNAKEHKNIPVLLRAFAVVKAKLPCRLVLSCRKEEIKGAEKLMEELNLHARITFLGHVDREELAVLYRHASVFVFPSLYEGFGYPPLEAMAHGTPVVASNVSSLPEVLGDAAVLVSPGSVEALADSIYNVMTDAALRGSLVRKGLERAGHFQCREMARKTLEIYREAAGLS